MHLISVFYFFLFFASLASPPSLTFYLHNSILLFYFLFAPPLYTKTYIYRTCSTLFRYSFNYFFFSFPLEHGDRAMRLFGATTMYFYEIYLNKIINCFYSSNPLFYLFIEIYIYIKTRGK